MAKTPVVAEVYTFALPPVKAEVESSNTVGYIKVQLPENKMDILANPFNLLTDENGIQTVDVVRSKNYPAIIGGEGFDLDGGDSIRFWDYSDRSYRELSWWDAAGGSGGVYTDGYEACLGSGWGDGDAIVMDATVSAGQGFWAKSVAGGEIIFTGEVPTSSSITVPVNRMNLVGNPLPCNVDIQEIVAGDGFDLDGGDSIRVWDPQTRSHREYSWWSKDGESGGVYTEGYEACLGSGWGDGDAIIMQGTILAGHGFWVKAVNGGTLVFPAIPSAD